MPTCIALTELSKRYGSIMAVDELSLEVETGEVLGLLGPNGAGKSTTLGMLSGSIWPTAGSVTVFNKELRRNFLDIAARMGVMPERPAFYETLTVRRNLKLQARLAQRRTHIDRTLDMLGLLPLAGTKVQKLSSGMRQRLALAQALLTEPELLILDEPTLGLDVEATQDMLRLIRRLADDAEVTIVFSSHLMHEVENLCDRVAILNKGRLVACEKTGTLLSYDQSQVEVLLESGENAARRLMQEDWVREVTVNRDHLIVDLEEANLHQLNAFLLNAGYRPAGLIPKRRTLQDYFLKVVNRT